MASVFYSIFYLLIPPTELLFDDSPFQSTIKGVGEELLTNKEKSFKKAENDIDALGLYRTKIKTGEYGAYIPTTYVLKKDGDCFGATCSEILEQHEEDPKDYFAALVVPYKERRLRIPLLSKWKIPFVKGKIRKECLRLWNDYMEQGKGIAVIYVPQSTCFENTQIKKPVLIRL